MQTYYELLGLSNSATPQEISKAYKKQKAKNNLNKADQQALYDAFVVLKDIDSRRVYDQAIKDAQNDQNPNKLTVVADTVAKAAIPLPLNPLAHEYKGDSVQKVKSSELNWSGWHTGFSFRFGRMNIGFAVLVALVIDAVYSVFLYSLLGPKVLSEVVFMPLFFFSIISSPIVAAQKGRHWIFWSIIALGGGTTGVLFPNHGPFSHVVFLALLLANPGKPRCPNPKCRKLVERYVSNCAKCGLSLRPFLS